MIREVTDNAIMTTREIRAKYAKYYICMVVIKSNLLNPDLDEGYAAYLADTYEESFEFPILEFLKVGKIAGTVAGDSVGGIEIGGIYLVD